MYRFLFFSFIILFMSELTAQDFSGTYKVYNPSNEVKIVLDLKQNSSGLVSGSFALNNNDIYEIEGKVEEYYGESVLVGSILKGNELSFFESYLEEGQLFFTWIPLDGNNQPDYNSTVDVVLNKLNLSNNDPGKEHSDMYRNKFEQKDTNYNSSKNDNYQRDPVLFGRWRYSESYTSGDFSMVTERYMEIHPDGTYSYGNGKMAGGGDSGSFESGNGGDITTGKWRTENGIIFIDEGGFGNWIAYSGYYVEGNSLLLKFENGSKEIWKRW
jgi:hypothetical protein